MNGHGGDQFLKFHDMEEVSSHDLGGALREMELKKRYHRVRRVVTHMRDMLGVKAARPWTMLGFLAHGLRGEIAIHWCWWNFAGHTDRTCFG